MLEALRNLRDVSSILRAAHRLLREPYYQGMEALYPRGFPIRMGNGPKTRLHPRFLGIQPERYEVELSQLLNQKVQSGDTVLDIGAHVGLHTIHLSQLVGDTGHVIAVEASPSNAELLRKHLSWNACSNVELIHAAAGASEGEVSFSYRADATDPSAFANSIAYDIGGMAATVRMTTIDAICASQRPRLIKIDVEGAELSVLQGAQEIIARHSPTLIVAIHPEPMRMMGTTPAKLVEFLNRRGYDGQHIDGRPAIDPGFEEILFEKEE